MRPRQQCELTSRLSRCQSLLPVLSRKCKLPRTHIRFCRARRDRTGAPRNRIRAVGSAAGAARATAQVKGVFTGCVAGRRPTTASHAVCSDRTDRKAGRMSQDSVWIRIAACENIPLREGRVTVVRGSSDRHFQCSASRFEESGTSRIALGEPKIFLPISYKD